MDPEAASHIVDVDLVSGTFANLDANSILVQQDPARDHHLKVGDRAAVVLPTTGKTSLTVAGIYRDSTYVGNYVVGMQLFEREFVTSNLDMLAFARRAPGVDAAAASAAVKRTAERFPQVKVEDRASFKASQESEFTSLLIAVNGLLGLALFIALLGIANTLALSVLERTREIGLLRAVGMIRRQTRAMILDESAMVALFGAALGIVVGLFFGAAVTTAMPDSAAHGVAVPITAIATIVVTAAFCGIGAGFVPARRAARLDVLTAISTQ